MSYPRYNYLCMIYNRYNPCHVVYVLYMFYYIFWRFVLSNAHTHHYTLISMQASGTSGGTPQTRRVQSEHRLLRARVLLLHNQNFNVACKTGIRYPSYEVMYCREKMSLCLSVSLFHWYTIVILFVYLSYFDFSWSDRTLSACWPCMAGVCV